MYPNGERERIRERFRSLRRDEEALAPPFETIWRAAGARRERARADNRLRFGLAASLCACTAALVLLLWAQPASEPPPSAGRAGEGIAVEPARAPVDPTAASDDPRTVQPTDAPDPARRLVAVPPDPERKVNRPFKGTRRQRGLPNTPCAQC